MRRSREAKPEDAEETVRIARELGADCSGAAKPWPAAGRLLGGTRPGQREKGKLRLEENGPCSPVKEAVRTLDEAMLHGRQPKKDPGCRSQGSSQPQRAPPEEEAPAGVG